MLPITNHQNEYFDFYFGPLYLCTLGKYGCFVCLYCFLCCILCNCTKSVYVYCVCLFEWVSDVFVCVCLMGSCGLQLHKGIRKGQHTHTNTRSNTHKTYTHLHTMRPNTYCWRRCHKNILLYIIKPHTYCRLKHTKMSHKNILL